VESSEKRATILVIDDDPNIRDLVSTALELDQYHVLLGKTGAEGLALATALRPEIIILDLMLPDMRGWEVLRSLKDDHRTKNIRVIFLSALDETDDRATGLHLGADDYIGKPFAVRELLARVHVQLRSVAQLRSNDDYQWRGESPTMGNIIPPSGTHRIFHTGKFKVDLGSVFVLMPFAPEFQPVYDDIIVPAVKAYDMNVVRADNIYSPGIVMRQIWEHINTARFLIADLTGKNPNVFYELGLALALEREVILLAQSSDDVPFDLRHMRYFHYSLTGQRAIEKSKEELMKTIKDVMLVG